MRIPHHIRRHRVFQWGLSLGVGVCAAYQTAMIGPDAVTLTQTIISWIWIWEQ